MKVIIAAAMALATVLDATGARAQATPDAPPLLAGLQRQFAALAKTVAVPASSPAGTPGGVAGVNPPHLSPAVAIGEPAAPAMFDTGAGDVLFGRRVFGPRVGSALPSMKLASVAPGSTGRNQTLFRNVLLTVQPWWVLGTEVTWRKAGYAQPGGGSLANSGPALNLTTRIRF